MRKLILAVPLVAALAALAVPSLASAAGSASCTDGSLGGTKNMVNSNVTVPAGAQCDLSWDDVKGNVDVYGTLTTYGITHFEGNVTVHPGGSYLGSNWGVTIDKNLSFTDPATYSYNGLTGDQLWQGTTPIPNVVKGQISYTITSATNYPPSLAPVSLFYNTTAKGFNYSDQGLGQHRAPDTSGLTIAG
jgi:hypothetical protein